MVVHLPRIPTSLLCVREGSACWASMYLAHLDKMQGRMKKTSVLVILAGEGAEFH